MAKLLAAGLLCAFGLANAQVSDRPTVTPMVSLSHYVLDGEPVTGPSVGLRFDSREIGASRFGFELGTILRPTGSLLYQSEPFIYTGGEKYYGLQPPISNGAFRTTSYGIGLGFIGVDFRTYLLEGDFRPYVGLGAHLVGWSEASTFTGTVAPEVMTGFDMRVRDQLSAFVEFDYLIGTPTLFGEKSATLSNIAAFAVGLNFAPRW
ncbi:MAG TPA: hypothetical protein VMM57_04795 [Bacteroidota bacterium]|nr:hypothetical protein [Bacteroidota bacterium]